MSPTSVKIIGSAGSTCGLRVFTTCKALGIPYEIIPVDFAAREHKSPEYLATKQPFGRIPVLIDGDFQLYESRAIARYLVSKYQSEDSVQLIPRDLQQAALVDQYISTEYSYWDPPVSGYVFEKLFKKLHGLDEADPAKVAELESKINEVLNVYDKILEGKSYLVGDHLTLADICHLPYGQYFYNLGGASILEDPSRPNVARWWKTISSEKVWQDAFPKQN